jgi:hypothetical protein
MFATERNIDTLEQLAEELKKYAGLQAEYASIQLVQKLTVLLSTLILVFVMLVLGIMVLFYLSFTLAYVMAPWVGGLMTSYALITAFILLLIVLIASFRQRLIVAPMVRFLTALFLSEETAHTTPEAKRQEVDESADRMAAHVQSLMAREPARPGVEGFVHHLQTGIAVYDGVRTGLKIMRRMQDIFGRKRRRRK